MTYIPIFEGISQCQSPFPHLVVEQLFPSSIAQQLPDFIKHISKWKLVRTSFYEQYEISILDTPEDSPLQRLADSEVIDRISGCLSQQLASEPLEFVDATIHKLVPGQLIGIHNDYLEGGETHRLVANVSSHWQESNGGYFVLFNNAEPRNVYQLIAPRPNSAIGFSISERSHHAISRVAEQERYSLVYSYRTLT